MTSPAPAASRAAPSRNSPRPGFRPDIQGLRAIAVLLVVLYHSGVEMLSGGFVGVDAFFVISGFLITTHLLGSLEREGRIRFGAFYAKRARRILPAALVVVALTLVASWIWMSPLLMTSVTSAAAATAAYVPNYFFALQGTDYLSEATPSVFQHYWSLGIEEQFYLVWPALLAVGFWLARGRQRRLLVMTAALTAASFVACVLLMDVSQPWTFFSLPTRAWELGVGALVAFVLRSGARWLSSERLGLLAWAGLAGLLVVAFTFDEATAFPGAAAALPVLATAAMILGGAAPGRLHATRVLSVAPLQFLGAISYSLYLVHWPLQVIPQAAVFSAEPLATGTTLALGAAAVPLAWLLHRTVERPVLSWQALRERSQWLTGAAALTASLGIVLASAGTHLAASQQTLSTDRTAAHEPAALEPAGEEVVPANLSPVLEEVAADNPSIYTEGCHRPEESTDPSGCRVGENDQAPLVFLVGDSHAANWYPALEQLAEEGRIRLDSNTKNSCLPLDTEQEHLSRPYTACQQWRDGVLDRVEQEQPDLVLLAGFHNPDRLGGATGEEVAGQWREGLSSTLSRIEGPEVAVIGEVPHQERTPPHCLAKHPGAADRCAEPRQDAFETSLQRAEEEAVRDAGARRMDLTEYLCNQETCPSVIGDTVAYRDGHHLTQTFSRQLAEPMWEQIEPSLA